MLGLHLPSSWRSVLRQSVAILLAAILTTPSGFQLPVTACCGDDGPDNGPCPGETTVLVNWSVSNENLGDYVDSDYPSDLATVKVKDIEGTVIQSFTVPSSSGWVNDCLRVDYVVDESERCVPQDLYLWKIGRKIEYVLEGGVNVPLGGTVEVTAMPGNDTDVLTVGLDWACPVEPGHISGLYGASMTFPLPDTDPGTGKPSVACQGPNNPPPSAAAGSALAAAITSFRLPVLRFDFGLGRTPDGVSAGSMFIQLQDLTAQSYRAGVLQYRRPPGADVVYQPGSTTALRQVHVETGLIDIVDGE